MEANQLSKGTSADEVLTIDVAPAPNPKILPLTGTMFPLALDGSQDALTQCVLKINEIIDYINQRP